jgi:hypothetical protein
VCQKLNKDLAAVKYVAYCPSVQNGPAGPNPTHTHMLVESHAEAVHTLGAPVSGRQLSGRGLPKPVHPQPVYTYPNDDELQRYQIVLWFSIIIAFVVIAAVYSLAFMSFKKDTMLYSSFNPNWEDRKRR